MHKTDKINTRYVNYLIKKYFQSQGKDRIEEYEDDELEKEFLEWLIEYRRLTENYAHFLEANNVNISDPVTAEIGKGFIDTVSRRIVTISEFAPTLGKPSLVMENVHDGILIYEGIRYITLDELGIETIITQNENSEESINDFEILANGQFRNIVFGEYGNFSDEDTEEKINIIKRLLENIWDARFIYDTSGGSYYLAVQSRKLKNKKRIKVKTYEI